MYKLQCHKIVPVNGLIVIGVKNASSVLHMLTSGWLSSRLSRDLYQSPMMTMISKRPAAEDDFISFAITTQNRCAPNFD